MKALLNKIIAWATSRLNNIKSWWNTTASPWLKISWLQIVNVIVMFYAYAKLDDALNGDLKGLGLATAIVGLWVFILLGYWIFWKFFRAGIVVKKWFAERKKEKAIKK